MIKCEKCNAVFSNEKIYNIHKLLCTSQIITKKQEIETKTKPRATTSKKKTTKKEEPK